MSDVRIFGDSCLCWRVGFGFVMAFKQSWYHRRNVIRF